MRTVLTALFISCLLTAAGLAKASGTSITITLVQTRSFSKVDGIVHLPKILESPWVPWWLSG